MKNVIYVIVVLAIMVTATSCKKFLSATSDDSLTIPTTLSDFQALLENNYMFEYSPSGTVLGGDNYYVNYSDWQTWGLVYKNSYIWAPDVYGGTSSDLLDWGPLYKIVYTSNIVIDGLKKVKVNDGNRTKYDFVKGMALFYRAFAFFSLAQVYAKPYIESSSGSDLGIPLKLTPDLNIRAARASVKVTYDQIIKDLKQAVILLPSNVQPNHLNYPSKPAVYALLSRTFLSMGEYSYAGLYADSSLMQYNTLMDYNAIDTTVSIPFMSQNPETMFQCYISYGVPVIRPIYTSRIVDTLLYDSYANNDLRKLLFFSFNNNGKPYFTGTYTGTVFLFNGFATDEMYLTRSESEARQGKTAMAMSDLNTLLVKRWKTGTFVPYNASNSKEALKLILQERRKELLCRGLRWTDLRRLNMEPEFAVTLTRILDGKKYSLPPNDLRYVYPIPDDEMKLSDLQQNQR